MKNNFSNAEYSENEFGTTDTKFKTSTGDNIIYPFTCSNSNEVSWLIWAANAFNITGSFYNKQTNISHYYYKVVRPPRGTKNPNVIEVNYKVR